MSHRIDDESFITAGYVSVPGAVPHDVVDAIRDAAAELVPASDTLPWRLGQSSRP